MNNFSYITPTRYIFGRNAENEVGNQAKANGMTNVLLVYGKGSVVRSGLLDRVKDALTASAIRFTELGGVQPNPTDEKVYEGIKLGRSAGVDGIIAVGGGSAIDTAKAIAAGIVYDGDFWDFYAGKTIVEKALPIGVVLTIPAAGSEGSGNSVITHRNGMKKISLRTDMALRPKFSCLNPELTYTLPPYQTACGICDMMIHIFERYFSPTPEVEVTDRVAEGLIKAIMTEAPKVLATPDNYDARANIMWSGTLAHNGVCGTGRVEDWASHFIEHELSALYDVAHGAGLAVTVPAWMTYVAAINPSKGAQFAERVLGIERCAGDSDHDMALKGIACLKDFFRSIGMPVTMEELGIKNADIDALVKNLHLHKGELIGGYVKLSAADTKKIYQLMA